MPVPATIQFGICHENKINAKPRSETRESFGAIHESLTTFATDYRSANP